MILNTLLLVVVVICCRAQSRENKLQGYSHTIFDLRKTYKNQIRYYRRRLSDRHILFGIQRVPKAPQKINAPYERPQLLLKCRPVAAPHGRSANMAACGDQCMKLSGPHICLGGKTAAPTSLLLLCMYVCIYVHKIILYNLNIQSIEPKVERSRFFYNSWPSLYTCERTAFTHDSGRK